MFLKFKKDYATHKVGDVVEVEDAIARAYVSAGYADEHRAAEDSLVATAVAELRTAMDADRASMRKEMADAIRSIGATVKPAPRVEAGESEEDRKPRNFADIVRNIYWEHSPDREFAGRAHDRLTKVYGLARANTESGGGGPAGGYVIKPEWMGDVYKIAPEDAIVEPRAFQIPMGNALELKWPSLDQYNTPAAGQAAIYAGVALYRKSEVGQRTESDLALKSIDFKITDLTGFTKVSRDLIADSFVAFDALVNQVFMMAFSWKKDYEFINGTGVGEPQGIRNTPSLIVVPRNTTNKILYEDVVAMQSRLMARCWPKAVWVTNVSCFPQLAAIKDAAGNNLFVSSANAGATNTPSGTLLGRPILYSEKIPPMGSLGDLNLWDISSYGVATRAGIEIGMSEHFLFDTDQIAFRFKLRNDGKGLMKKPYTQSDGGKTSGNTTVSPFITLKDATS